MAKFKVTYRDEARADEPTRSSIVVAKDQGDAMDLALAEAHETEQVIGVAPADDGDEGPS
jgi:hypothetical protein